MRHCAVTCESAPALASLLTNHIWTECTGFRFSGLLFLHAGGGEWRIVREETRELIESITFGWCDEVKALGYIQRLAWGTLGEPYGFVITPVDRPGEHGTCGACA